MVASMAISVNAKRQYIRMLLVCVESGKIPPLCKSKKLICEASSFVLDRDRPIEQGAVLSVCLFLKAITSREYPLLD